MDYRNTGMTSIEIIMACSDAKNSKIPDIHMKNIIFAKSSGKDLDEIGFTDDMVQQPIIKGIHPRTRK